MKIKNKFIYLLYLIENNLFIYLFLFIINKKYLIKIKLMFLKFSNINVNYYFL